ncbi:TPA: bifunctional hydroxymethylpyrimidine kinase/phosphomethylpyrimidine kinase [Candidatus Galligastranaerophilus intestinigallinarum]|nr:bifunctional hydroxymethylpyrimidine kinase/phosphomethylpyrimidine kinase [Candidatus Galligastranaerophilus intestinigallinarum]
MDKKKILDNLNKLKEPKILVIGDFAIDEMVFGQTERISREAPVLILEHTETKIILGTASNAANNISSLNSGKVGAIGVLGDDYYGKVLINALNEAKINTDFMVVDKERKTTTKTRISGSCSQSVTQQIVRIDRQTKTPVTGDVEKKIIENIKKAMPMYDGVILSDYHLGCLTQNVITAAIEEAKKLNKIIVADIQKEMEKYKGVTAITPNQPDTEKFVSKFIKDDKTLNEAGLELMNKLDLKTLLITRGENGMAVFEKGKEPVKIPAFNKKEVFDVTGAGDTVVAAFTLALCAGFSAKEAAIIGNTAASIVIRHFGCHTTNIDEIEYELRNLSGVNL